MKIYTKTGDKGTTSLYDGNRIGKHEIIFDVLGQIDELSSRIGLCYATFMNNSVYRPTIALADDNEKRKILYKNINYLREIQSYLQDINSIIATIDKKIELEINCSKIEYIEQLIDEMNNLLPKLTKFILPGKNINDALVHTCRTQTRNVERYLWELHTCEGTIKGKKDIILNEIQIPENIFIYINRLSDYFFTLARYSLEIIDMV